MGKLRKLIEKEEIELPAQAQLLTLLRCAKLHLKIKSPSQLEVFFKKLGIEDLVGGLPNIKDFLEEMSPAAKGAV